jgi:hypothetical protein
MKLFRVKSMYTLTPMYPMHVQGQAHREVQKVHEAHKIDQDEQEVVPDALISV